MEFIQTFLVSSLFALLIIILLFAFKSKKRHYKNLPPGPSYVTALVKKFPIPSSELLKLSNKYGPIMSIWVGSRHLSVVISSASLAKECFTTNDVILANRPKTLGSKHLAYNHTALASAPYGPHWQNLRRIFTGQLFTTGKLNNNDLVRIRKDEVGRLLSKLHSNACQDEDDFKRVEFMNSMFWEMSFNMLVRMITGKGHDYCNKKVKHYRGLMLELRQAGGFGNRDLPNLPNFPNLAKKIDIFFQTLIDEQRISNKEAGGHEEDQSQSPYVISNLLYLQESNPDYYTDEIIKGIFSDIIIVPIGSLSITLQWAIASLLNNPEVLKRAREEIDVAAQVGGEDKVLEENDFAKLHYLQSILWETLRLYPVVPLLIPHKSSEECSVGGYRIPRGTMVVANAYAIHRDPKLWDDATSFKPERFDEENIDQKETYKFLPFGLGRRACPGARLSNRILGLCLGSMIQCFEWKRVSDEKIDMTEREGGVNMTRARKLEAMIKARPIINKILNKIE